jgi:hypothetical protein
VEPGKLFARGGVRDTQVHGPVSVTIRLRRRTGCCQATSGKRALILIEQSASGFAADREVAQQRIVPLPVASTWLTVTPRPDKNQLGCY